jgi:PAS domain S-box-containing protein
LHSPGNGKIRFLQIDRSIIITAVELAEMRIAHMFFINELEKMTYLFESEPRSEEELTAENEIVYTLDLAGNFKFVNAIGERITGYSCEEARRMNLTDLVAPELADYVRDQITRSTNRSFGAVFEIEIITKDQRRVVLETSTHLVVRRGCPVEIRGIALPPIRTSQPFCRMRARCLDMDFSFGTL